MVKKVNRLRILMNKQYAGVAARYYTSRYRSAQKKGDKVATRFYRLKLQSERSLIDDCDMQIAVDETMCRIGLSANDQRRINYSFVGGR